MVALKIESKIFSIAQKPKRKVRKIASSGWLMILRTMTEVKSVRSNRL